MKSDTSNLPPRTNSMSSDQDSISWPAPLLDAACAIAKQKVIVCLIICLGLLFGIIRLTRLPTTYTASAVAVLMSREKPILDASIDTNTIETTDDRAARSDTGSLMLPPNPSLYTTLIESRAVLSRIALKYERDLAGHLSPRDRSEEVYHELKSMVEVSSTEEGLMTVTVSTEDPELSAKLANEFFEECKRASKAIEKQLILQQAGHLEEALISAQARLKTSENRLREFTAQYELINVDLQAGNQLRSIRELEAQKDKLRGELDEMLLNYAEKSPEVQRVRARIRSLEKLMEEASNSIVGPINMENFGGLLVTHKSLTQKIQFERDMVATLSTQADLYRIRAEQPTGNLAVIKSAVAPERPAGPSKKRELGLFLGLSIFLSIGWALATQQWEKALQNQLVAERIDELVGLALSESSRSRLARMKRFLQTIRARKSHA